MGLARTVLCVPRDLPSSSGLPWLVHMAARKDYKRKGVGGVETDHCYFCYTVLAKASHQVCPESKGEEKPPCFMGRTTCAISTGSCGEL